MSKRGQASLQIILLILSIVAFVFLIGNSCAANKDDEAQLTWGGLANYFSKNKENGLSLKVTSTPLPSGEGGKQEDIFSALDKKFEGLGWLAKTAMWMGGAYYFGKMLGNLFGEENSVAGGQAAMWGAATYRLLGTNWVKKNLWGGFTKYPLASGIVVGAIIFVINYRKTDTKTVTFTCNPWQAPSGGKNCELCNDGGLPCSEYRCMSLGQACELLNKGQENEKCAWVNPHDVNPPEISQNLNDLTSGYVYTPLVKSPPGQGFRIEQKSGECVPPFTPIRFGVVTDEPAQCKIDFNHTEKFEEMNYWLGETNLYLNNHTQLFSLPGPSAYSKGSLTINNDGEWIWFIRCKDKNGNENTAEYAVEFCVDPSPDTTPPKIEETSIANGACVAECNDNVEVGFYLNEPADCKWSHNDMRIENMENEMKCNVDITQMNAKGYYKCAANLTGITRGDTKYYIRCKDQPDAEENNRVSNEESYVYVLKSSTALKMMNLQPNSTIYSGINPAPVYLTVETLFGCGDGKAYCFYSTNGVDGDYIQFYDTKDIAHKQRQDLVEGEHTYWFKCIDSGGNVAINQTTFKVEIDKTAPVIARVYEEDNMLKIITVLKSECAYSFENCDFTFERGTDMPYANSTTHVSEWQEDKTYYIKCRDEFRNEPADCSLVVQPSENFL